MAKSNSQVTTLDDDTSNNPTAAVESAAPAVAQVKGANHDDQLSGKRRTITIHPTDADGGSDAVFVSLNGYAYQIPRATPQSIPEEVFEILKNARTTLYTSGGANGVTERTVQRYAFSAE